VMEDAVNGCAPWPMRYILALQPLSVLASLKMMRRDVCGVCKVPCQSPEMSPFACVSIDGVTRCYRWSPGLCLIRLMRCLSGSKCATVRGHCQAKDFQPFSKRKWATIVRTLLLLFDRRLSAGDLFQLVGGYPNEAVCSYIRKLLSLHY
jgi:hypothetical protein